MSVEEIERLRVAWVDTDAGGRIHFTAVFRYAELAGTVLRRPLGLLGDWADYPRRHVEADYLAVLRFDDEVELTLRPERVGRTSITWAGRFAPTTRSRPRVAHRGARRRRRARGRAPGRGARVAIALTCAALRTGHTAVTLARASYSGSQTERHQKPGPRSGQPPGLRAGAGAASLDCVLARHHGADQVRK